MRPSRPRTLVVSALVAGVLVWAALRVWEARGGGEPTLLWGTTATIALLVAAVLAVGWPVRQWVNGDKARRIDALRAARTAALAKAAAVGGSLLAGGAAGVAVHYVATVEIAARRGQLVVALADLLVSALLVAAGLLVQRWCRVPPDDDDPRSSSPA